MKEISGYKERRHVRLFVLLRRHHRTLKGGIVEVMLSHLPRIKASIAMGGYELK